MTESAASASQNCGAFSRLPPEILINIIGHFISYGRHRLYFNDFPTLKALRLAHRNFANLRHINEFLFRSIQLLPTQRGLENIEHGDLSLIADCVRTISFVTPPSRAMTFETFAEIVKNGAINTRLDELGAVDESVCYGKSTHEEFMQQHMGGQWPFSETQLRDAFDAYAEHARPKEILLGGSNARIEEAWVKALKVLGNRERRVRFYTHRDDYVFPDDSDARPPGRAGPDHDANAATQSPCKRASAVLTDAVVATALSCIAISGLKVFSLSIKCQLTGDFNWEAIPGWDRLDLSALRKLKFVPRIPSVHLAFVPKGLLGLFPILDSGHTSKRACEALNLLVDKSHASLRRLIIEPDADMCWPHLPASHDLPMLESLNCHPGSTQPTLLANWVARMPRLEHLGVGGNKADGVPYTTWLDLFDALRDHPRALGPDAPGIGVNFEQIVTNDWTELSWGGCVRRKQRDIENRPRVIYEDFDEDGDIEVDLAMESHVIYAEPYRQNRALRSFLQDDEEYSDSDEDGDGSDWDEEEEEEDGDEDGSDDEDVGRGGTQ